MGSIMLSPTMMALSMGNQVLCYGIGTRKIANIEAQLKAFTDRRRAYEEALHPALREADEPLKSAIGSQRRTCPEQR